MNNHNEDFPERIKKLKKASEAREPSERLQSLWQFQNDIYINLSQKGEEENLHWEQYKAQHLNDKYFALSHIEDIGLPFDVAMVLTKRGTGKTFSYMQMLEKVAAKGEQFVIVRNTKQELEGGVMEDLYRVNSPFEVTNDKVHWAGDSTQVVGYLAHLNGTSQKWQGAGYEKVTTIIWDEATNAGDTTTRTAKWIRAFWQLTSTFFRNRANGKIWIFGNLMKDHEGKISDLLHKYLGLDSDLNFKYVINTSEQGTKYKLLYVNTGNLYKGADEHIMTNISLSKEIRQDLASNLPSKMGECILPDYYFTKAQKKEWGILTNFDKQSWMILIASEPFINLDDPDIHQMYLKGEITDAQKRFYIIRCEVLRKGQIGFKMKIFTDDVHLWNLHKDVAFLKKKDKMKKFWYKLYKICKSGNAFYVGDNSYIDITRIMNGRKDEIEGVKKDREEKIKKTKKSKKK